MWCVDRGGVAGSRSRGVVGGVLERKLDARGRGRRDVGAFGKKKEGRKRMVWSFSARMIV